MPNSEDEGHTSDDLKEPEVTPRSDRLGKLGERIVRLALEEYFTKDYVDRNIQGPEKRGKGPDYVDKESKLAIEVKFWIRASEGIGGYADFRANILDHFKTHKKKNGWKPQVIIMGKRPLEWSDIVRWSNLNNMQPHFIPFGFADQLDKQVEQEDFDVEGYAWAAYHGDLRPSLLKVISLVSEPYKELSDNEWEAVKGLIPWKAMGYRELWGGGWRRKHRKAKASERVILDGLLHLVSVNGRTREYAAKYGKRSTATRRLKMWREDGTWENIIHALGLSRFMIPPPPYSRQDNSRTQKSESE